MEHLFVPQTCPYAWHEETLNSIRAVLRGRDISSRGYDSDDDPKSLINKRLEVSQISG